MPSVPLFLCDRMLIRLGRWLRAAGYDTGIAGGATADRDLLDWAVREDRLLVTRDRKFIEFREAPGRVILLGTNETESCAAELSGRQVVEWLHRPFTRCLECNAPLGPAAPRIRAALPGSAQTVDPAELRWCATCRKLYWPGSHVRRMRSRLERWQRGAFSLTDGP